MSCSIPTGDQNGGGFSAGASNSYVPNYKPYSTTNQVEPYANFYPVIKKGPNYLKYCVGLLHNHEKPYNTKEIIKKYTSGTNMSFKEIEMYERQYKFFIPSFTSTSKTKPFLANTIFHIDITPEWNTFCIEIDSSMSDYNEDEILLSCYNIYEYKRSEMVNNKRYIKLTLLNYETNFDVYRDRIV
ncbi:unnamed protein product [Didymodactylos carnosus]|uniref:Uncharacterized protein n=1 Tax=Didymodactylos carnosus TaxID=1234261 RepID=A0A815NFY6_9BILA|nr:unnamed protein product [Didymodactylos carnosus]CAF1429045.1 unnamed protein product [Didymodactylos carnosus]CAF4148967.1 unnamed protein product [Didymodactylos carnosus]CAF4308349.1 unnamed protein product [Didymodactylos carnosus]